jgi:hypothetical protein
MLELRVGKAKTNLLRLFLEQRSHLVSLGDVSWLASVHPKVGIVNDDFLLPVLDFLHLGLLQLLHHVISRNEDSLEEFAVSEGRRATEVGKEIDLA